MNWPALLGAVLMAATCAPAHGQDLISSADPMGQARAAEARRDPAEALARYLRVLSTRPRDLEALTGAGRAALDIGDPNAAVGFYARAEEIAPRNGQVKAGLGSAMLQMENSRAALRLFDEAVDRGVAPGEVAGDRGLAYDLRGDARRAQQEYALALKTRDDPETRRRLALSLAMSGDRAAALATLDPLLRKQDIPAWRARAFVLALTGDAPGAEKAALAVMPGNQATALLPFLARLPSLKPQQQAAAVHFGRFPSDGRRPVDDSALADAGTTRKPPAGDGGPLVLAGPEPARRGDRIGAPAATAATARATEPVSTAPRRRPGASSDRLASLMASVLASDPAEAAVDPGGPSASSAPPPQSLPAQPPARQALPAGPSASGAPVTVSPPARKTEASSGIREKAVPADKKAKPVDPKAKDVKTAEAKDAANTKNTANSKDNAKSKDDAKSKDVATAKAKDSDKAKDADKAKDPDKGKKADGAERYWVQVAGGANKADLPKAYDRLKEKTPKLFAGRSAWTTPLRATNRLLVGPFKTEEEAQSFVNQAGKQSVSAFAYTSPPSQKVEKLSAK